MFYFENKKALSANSNGMQNLKIAQNQDRIEFQGDELSCISNAILIQILVSS